MRVIAYCCASFTEATEKAAGVKPLSSPPYDSASFDPAWLSADCYGYRYDLIYLDLHGQPGEACWRGDGGIVALTADQIRSVALGGSVVFAVNCFLADSDSPMLEALLEAGARYVVGGTGENFGGEEQLMGAGLMGARFRVLMEQGFEPLLALDFAKRWMRLYLAGGKVFKQLSPKRMRAAEDALQFRAYYRKRGVPSSGIIGSET